MLRVVSIAVAIVLCRLSGLLQGCDSQIESDAPILMPGPKLMKPGDSRLQLLGRHLASRDAAKFDWVGTGVSFRISDGAGITRTTMHIDMDGSGARFTVLENGKEVTDFFSTDGRKIYDVDITVQGGDIVSLIKSSESELTTLYGVEIDSVIASSSAQQNSRRIDIYGDSDTAGYGVDGQWWWPSCTTSAAKYNNYAHGWPPVVASLLQADLHVQAISGIGVTQNAGGTTSRTLPALLDRTLHSVDADDYDGSSWIPSLIVFYVGSNDFVSWESPSKEEFTNAYTSMVGRVTAPFGSRAPPVVHVCGQQDKPCNWIADIAASTGQIFTRTKEGWPEAPEGCFFHRDVAQQKALAERLAPVFASAAGWNF